MMNFSKYGWGTAMSRTGLVMHGSRICGGWLRRVLCAVAAIVALLPSCTTADDRLGYDFVPDDQKMTMRRAVLERTASGRQLLTTRLFRTDSIVSSNVSYGYMGQQNDKDFGVRKAGFFTQYLVVGTSDSLGFGYRPIFDSIQLVMSIADYKGDTLEPQKFNVYEVTEHFFDANVHEDGTTDSIFYLTFDPSDFHGKRYISSEPAFTFVFPDGVSTGPATETVRMMPTQTGLSLIRRLMLVEGEYKDNDMSVYRDDEQWVDYFKGFYIEPASESVEKGAMFALNLEESGFTIYGRNRYEDDPELVRDTTQALYYFYDSKAAHGNQSVNSVKRDFAGTALNDADMLEKAGGDAGIDARPEVDICYVEGMGGPITEITFTDEFFRRLEALLDDSDDNGNIVRHSNIAFNQAKMQIYLRESDYDWEKIDPDQITDVLDASLTRLGLYTNFKNMAAIADYNYIYESQYSVSINYGGYLSRSLGCYEMDITAYIQGLWNRYLALEDKSDLSSIANRTVYLAPEAYNVYGFGHAIVQGMDGGSNGAPIKMELTYTLIR